MEDSFSRLKWIGYYCPICGHFFDDGDQAIKFRRSEAANHHQHNDHVKARDDGSPNYVIYDEVVPFLSPDYDKILDKILDRSEPPTSGRGSTDDTAG